MAALSDIRSEAYIVLNEDESTSGSYPSATMDDLINQEQERVLREFRMPFSIKRAFFDTSVDTTLDGDVATSDTEIELTDSSSWASCGKLWINGDIITYTGNASNQLTGVTNISATADDNDTVVQLYTLPSDFDEAIDLRKWNANNSSTPIQYYDTREGESNQSGKWTTDFDEDGTEVIVFDNPSTTERRVLKYYGIPSTMSADSDTTVIPDPWAEKILPLLAAGRFLIMRDEEQKGEFLIAKGNLFASQMQIAYTQREKKFRRKIPIARRHTNLNLKVGGNQLRHVTRLDLTSS